MSKKGKFLKLTSGVVLLGSAPSLVSMADENEDTLKMSLKFLANVLGIGFVLPYIVLLARRKAELKKIEASLKDVEDKLGKKEKDFEECNIALKKLNDESEQVQKDLEDKKTSLNSLKIESEQVRVDLVEKDRLLASLKEQYEKEKAEVEKIEESKKNLEKEINQKKSEIDAKRKKIEDAEKEGKVLDKEVDLKEGEKKAEEGKLNQLKEVKAFFEKAVKSMREFVECSDFLRAADNLELAESGFNYSNKVLKDAFLIFKIKVADEDYNDVEKLLIKSKELAKSAGVFVEKYYRFVKCSGNIVKAKVEEKEGKCIIDLAKVKQNLKEFLDVLEEFDINSVSGEPVSLLFGDELQRLKGIYENFDTLSGGGSVNVKDEYNKICEDVKIISDKVYKSVEGITIVSNDAEKSKKWIEDLGNLPNEIKRYRNEADRAKECVDSFNKKYSKEYTSKEIEKILRGDRYSSSTIKCTTSGIKDVFEKMKEIDRGYFSKEKGKTGFDCSVNSISEICEGISYCGRTNPGRVGDFCKDFLDYYDEHEKAFLENKIDEQEEKVKTLEREEEKLRENLRKALYDFHILSTTLVYEEYNKVYKEAQAAYLEQEQKDRWSTFVSGKEKEINELSEEYKNLVSEKEKKLEEQKSLKEKINELSEECKDFELRKRVILASKDKLEEEIKDLSEKRKRVLEGQNASKMGIEDLSKQCKDLEKEVRELENQKSGIGKRKRSMSTNFYSLNFFKSFD